MASPRKPRNPVFGQWCLGGAVLTPIMAGPVCGGHVCAYLERDPGLREGACSRDASDACARIVAIWRGAWIGTQWSGGSSPSAERSEELPISLHATIQYGPPLDLSVPQLPGMRTFSTVCSLGGGRLVMQWRVLETANGT